MKDLQPILLGSDINVYGMARAFHEAYGITSQAFAHFQLSPTKFSHIVTVTIVQHFSQHDIFVATLLDYAHKVRKDRPETALLLIPCGDLYANLLSESAEELRPYYAFNSLEPGLTRQLSNKSSFYQLCQNHNLPYPTTKVIGPEGVERGDHKDLPFGYPVAMKPVDSSAWLDIDFPGREKAFIIDDPDKLDLLIRRAYQAGYHQDMVIQDFIPGDDSRMRVLNAYVDRHHRVRMMFLGHPLLEDPTPEAVGNYAVILPDYEESIMLQIKDFLEDINYEGVANFDMKFDERDGQYKMFEINLRQGRSSYFVTLNGFNLAEYFVNDLVEDKPFDGQTVLGHGSKLWLEIPRSIFRQYVCEGEDKEKAMAMLADGDWGTTLEYRKDMNPLRWALIKRMFSIYKRRYAQFFKKKADI